MLESRRYPMQVQSNHRSETYQITSDDYGTRLRRLMGATLHFFVTWLLMFIGLSAPDFFTKSPHMVPGSRELLSYSLGALIVAGF